MRAKLTALALSCALGLLVAVAVAAAGTPRTSPGALNVRVLGHFQMSGQITRAINVAGERPGELINRHWLIRPLDCSASDCQRLVLVRQRGHSAYTRLTLRRTGPGQYRGNGSFWVRLRCLGHTWPHGADAQYLLTLKVVKYTQIGAIRYATQIHATYTNTARRDRTKCPLGISRDAASYGGIVKSGLPAPPPVTTTTTTTVTPPPPPTTVPTVPTVPVVPPSTTTVTPTPAPVTTATDTTMAAPAT